MVIRLATRRERVVLELDDSGFSTQMLRNALATTTLERALKSLDGTNVRIDQRINTSTRQLDGLSQSATRGAGSINQLTGRIAALAQATLVLGPALIPIGAVAVPAITGLASSLGFAAIGMGTLVTAAQGVGDALKAVNTASLEPTAANLEKAGAAMAKLGPEAQLFVERFQEIRPVLADIRDSAAAGWFPGLTESLDDMDRIAPRVADVFRVIGETGGGLVAEAADALAGPEWAQFITFVENEAPQALEDLGRTVGNATRGLAELWMAFAPLNDGFSSFLLDASAGFAEWADGLSETDGFTDFIGYLQEMGPKVEDTLGSIATAVVAIIKAAAPLGGPVLEAFELVADAITTIAESSAGSKIVTMAAAFVVLNKALAVTAGLLARTGLISAAGAAGMRGLLTGGGRGATGAGAGGTGASGTPLVGRLQSASTSLRGLRGDLRAARELRAIQMTAGARSEREIARMRALNEQAARGRSTMAGLAKTTGGATAGIAAFAVASGAAGQNLGLQNTAMLGLVGSMAGPVGAAIGASVGLMIDLSKGTDSARESIEQLQTLTAAGAGTAELSAALDVAGKDVEDFARVTEMTMGDFGKNWIGGDGLQGVKDNFTALKSGVEGVFGDSDLEEIQKDYDKAREAADRASRSARVFADSQEILARRKGISEWASAASAEFLNLAEKIDKPTISLGRLMERMENQGRAAARMGRNLRRAIENGADPTALQHLIDTLGPQAGLALRQLAAGGEGAARRFNRAWATTQSRLGRVEGAIQAVGTEIGRLPDGRVIRVTAETQRAQSMIEQIKAQVASIKDKTVRVNVFTNYLRGATLAAQGGRDGDPATSYWSGGYTGHGGKYERAGDAHRGEVVIPQEDVQRDKAFLVSRYGHLPGMDQLAARANASTAISPVKVPRATVDRARASTAGPSLMHLTGTVQSELGPMRIEGIARAAARDEIDQQNTWERTQ